MRMLPSQNSQSHNSLVVVVVLYILTLCVLSVQVLDGDFFLVACIADFIENARLCIFETFCRIRQCIKHQVLATCIRESVDSLCRDGADRTRPFSKLEWPRTPKRGSYKPFWTHTRTLRVILYPLRPSKYVKYTATMTYGSCHTPFLDFFVHHLLLLLLLQLNWPTAKAAQVPSLVFT